MHWAMLWPPDLVRCINSFVEFHILYSFPQNPHYHGYLLLFYPLLSDLSHPKIKRIIPLLLLSSSRVRLDIIVVASLLQLMDPGTQEEGSGSRRKSGRKFGYGIHNNKLFLFGISVSPLMRVSLQYLVANRSKSGRIGERTNQMKLDVTQQYYLPQSISQI